MKVNTRDGRPLVETGRVTITPTGDTTGPTAFTLVVAQPEQPFTGADLMDLARAATTALAIPRPYPEVLP